MAVAVLTFVSGIANAGSSRSSGEPKVLFAGGVALKSVAGVKTLVTLSSAELFEPRNQSGSFVGTGKMDIARVDHSATRLDSGHVLIAGGSSAEFGARTVFASAEIYDLSTGKFSATGTMLEPRTGLTATLLPNGQVLIAGGDDGTTSLTNAELYDPAMATFAATGAMNFARDRCTATLLANGKVLIAGGIQLLPDGSGGILDTAELYDPVAGSFSLTGTMTSSREMHTATLLLDGRMLITGGVSNDGGVLDTAELYDPATGLFSPAGHMTTTRYGHLAAVLGDSDVLVAGGFDDAGSTLASAEVFVAASGEFVKIPSMPRDRFFVGATALTSNTILIAGGYTQCRSSAGSVCEKPVRSALIFDHTSNTFRSMSPMKSARGSFASASLQR